jgi:hypothetical protein
MDRSTNSELKGRIVAARKDARNKPNNPISSHHSPSSIAINAP